MRGPITCHVLDTELGKPGAGIEVQLSTAAIYPSLSEISARPDTATWQVLGVGVTDADGRCNDVLPSGTRLNAGLYRMRFLAAAYFDKQNRAAGGAAKRVCFYPYVDIVFHLEKTNEHYHIPLLISSHAYSTYRGS